MQQQIFEEQEDNIDIQKIIGKYLQHWKWILLFTFVFCGTAYFYLKVQPSTFISSSTVLVKDDKKGSLGGDLDIFSDLGLSKGNSNLHNEIEVFKSRDLVQKVVKELHLNKLLIQVNNTFNADHYYYKANSPLSFKFVDTVENHYNKSFVLELSRVNKEGFILLEKVKVNGKVKTQNLGQIKYGESFPTQGGTVQVNRTENFKSSHLGEKFNFIFSSLSSATNKWKSNFEVNTVNKDASVLKLSAKGLMKEANNDFLEQMIIEHEENAIADKNEITKNTSDFISERMKVIEDELSEVEGINEKFKTDTRLVDVEKNAEIYLEQEGSIEKIIVETNIQLSLAKYMVEYLEEYKDYNTLLPSNLGFTDHSINAMTQEYNTLVLERNRLVQGSSEANPLAQKLENQLTSLRNSINSSLKKDRKSTRLNSSHVRISYAVFCLKKKKKKKKKKQKKKKKNKGKKKQK